LNESRAIEEQDFHRGLALAEEHKQRAAAGGTSGILRGQTS
jgi:hypothetical protein